MISRKVLLLFLCGLAAAYLALFHQPKRKIVVIRNTAVSSQHSNKDDLSIQKNIKQIVKPALPHLSELDWDIKAIEHHGPYVYVLADAMGEDKREGTYKFVLKLDAEGMETIGTYSLDKSKWKLVYGKDPVLSNKKILKE